jgi:hypothetical protein
MRDRHATLRAFERRLGRLLSESESKAQSVLAVIGELDAKHPTYRTQYAENYRRALGESGMKPEDVAFMRFLEEDPHTARSAHST